MPTRPDCAAVLAVFDLGEGTLSSAPLASGRVGDIWRLDATSGTWAVKTDPNGISEAGSAPAAAFQEAAIVAGLPAPAVQRTPTGDLVGWAGVDVRVFGWVDLEPQDPGLDPVLVGRLLAGLHQLPITSLPGLASPETESGEVDPWFQAPVGAAAWDALIAELARAGAPFADAMASHRDELVALEAGFAPPQDLRWCHRDLFADNVRATTGGLVVFDFDNSGPCDPAWELAAALVEYATSPDSGRARVDADRAWELTEAYRKEGGPARLQGPGDFTMVAAVLGHITEIAGRRWLATADPAEQADLAAWAAELTDRPLTRRVVDELLDATT